MKFDASLFVIVLLAWPVSVHNLATNAEPSYVAWSPPPEFASKTWGHKTMYLADVTIGVNGQRFKMLVDTGSSMVVVPAAKCSEAGCSKHRRFDVRNSTDSHQKAAVSFAHGSMSGHIFSDIVCAEKHVAHLHEVGLLQKHAAVSRNRFRHRHRPAIRYRDGAGMCTELSLLVADHVSDDFVDAPFDGILGLGLPEGMGISVSRIGNQFSFLKQLRATDRLADAVYTLRLGNQGASEVVFGAADETNLVGGRFLWVPLSLAARGHWQISLSDLTLNGVPQHTGALEVIVDSGTSLLAPDEDLTNWFKARLLPTDCASVDSLPQLGLLLPSGSELTLLPSDYIDRIDGKCNLAIMPLNVSTSSTPASLGTSKTVRMILGDSFLRRFTTVFDLQQRRLGFGVASGSDLAKTVATALFPDLSPASFEIGRPQRPSWEKMEDSNRRVVSSALRGSHTGLTARTGNMEKPTPTIIVENSAGLNKTTENADVASTSTMDAEEQAGYDFAFHLLDSGHQEKTQFDHGTVQTVQSKERAQNGSQPVVGNTTEDKLKAASNKLDLMLNALKVQSGPASNQTDKLDGSNVTEDRFQEQSLD